MSRTTIELTVLIVVWVLGGSVGIGTALSAATVGPLVSRTLPRLTMRPQQFRAGPCATS